MSRQEGNEGKYKDPLRQLLYTLTSDANELVQMYKNSQKKIMNGELVRVGGGIKEEMK